MKKLQYFFSCAKKVSNSAEAGRESRRESHSRFVKSSRANPQTSVLSVANSAEGIVADSESEEEKLNLTPCIAAEKWYSLTIGLQVPTKEKDGALALLMHIFDWVSFKIGLTFLHPKFMDDKIRIKLILNMF